VRKEGWIKETHKESRMLKVVLVFLIIGLLTGCGCFPMAKYPPPDPPLVDEPAKILDFKA
jgi:hypothetical protein